MSIASFICFLAYFITVLLLVGASTTINIRNPANCSLNVDLAAVSSGHFFTDMTDEKFNLKRLIHCNKLLINEL